ncbi:hypothetical protein AB2C56_33045, partial [Pseudomonas aeruginosa]
QKIPIPIVDGTLSINFITVPLILIWLYSQRQIYIAPDAIIFFSLFCACAFVSNLIGDKESSISSSSFFLLCYAQIWFCIKPSSESCAQPMV